MELALNLGMPVDRLSREMTEHEFRDWRRYARQHGLPFRRVELYLAQVAWSVARYLGGNDQATVADFMIDFGERRREEVVEVDLDEAKAAFKFSPRKKTT